MRFYLKLVKSFQNSLYLKNRYFGTKGDLIMVGLKYEMTPNTKYEEILRIRKFYKKLLNLRCIMYPRIQNAIAMKNIMNIHIIMRNFKEH
ncbi:hypothetical protein BpHYR1_040007 [Brachionus plicatilis]|uniref:Uncharacterized protein n=1 Tax=Brachionus plicatilis TaxID=10195 RepID=A0A3M7P7T2_BRAPC|nr:hypothetical protein BpHYR1_040007 [Brachionus plicatilis]